MNLLDAAPRELAFGGGDEIQMGSGLSADPHRRIADVYDLAGYIFSDFVAAGADGGTNPGFQDAGFFVEIVEGPLDDATDEPPPTCMDRCEASWSFKYDG